MDIKTIFWRCDNGFHSQIQLQIWQGWIYLSLNPDVKLVADQLQSLGQKIGQFAMIDYVETFREEHGWDTN